MHKENHQEIEVSVNGDVILVTVTKITTCSDVAKSLTVNPATPKCLQHSYALFESSRGVERQLPGKTKVLKIARGWGSDTNGFQLVVRPVDNLAKETKFSTFKQKLQRLRRKCTEPKSNQELERACELANIVKTQFSRLEKLRNGNLNQSKDVKECTKNSPVNQTTDSMAQFMTKVDPENMADFLNFCCVVSNNEKRRLADENIEIQKKDSSITRKLNDACHMDQREGKREILKRFLSSQKPSHRAETEASSHQRTRGDGAESDPCTIHRIADGASIIDNCHGNRCNQGCEVSVETHSDYGSVDLDEAFMEQFECGTVTEFDLGSVSDDSDYYDMNACLSEDDIADIIINSSSCMSESDEGLSSVGNDK